MMSLLFNLVETELEEPMGPPRGSYFTSMILSFLAEKTENINTHTVVKEVDMKRSTCSINA